jgi:hypothetical protein
MSHIDWRRCQLQSWTYSSCRYVLLSALSARGYHTERGQLVGPRALLASYERHQWNFIQFNVSFLPALSAGRTDEAIIIIQGRASYLNRGPPAASGMRILLEKEFMAYRFCGSQKWNVSVWYPLHCWCLQLVKAIL